MTFKKEKKKTYGIFRGEKILGRNIWENKEEAEKEAELFNKQLKEINKDYKENPEKFKDRKPIELVEVKEYKIKIKKRTAEQKLNDCFN